MAEGGTTLEYTPTWVVALVCTVIVFISLTVERILHYIGKVYAYPFISTYLNQHKCSYASTYLILTFFFFLLVPQEKESEATF